MPTEVVEALDVEQFSRRTVRFISIPADPSAVADYLCDGFGQFHDRKIVARPDIDRSFTVVVVQQEVACIGEIVRVHKFPPRLTRSPAGD